MYTARILYWNMFRYFDMDWLLHMDLDKIVVTNKLEQDCQISKHHLRSLGENWIKSYHSYNMFKASSYCYRFILLYITLNQPGNKAARYIEICNTELPFDFVKIF